MCTQEEWVTWKKAKNAMQVLKLIIITLPVDDPVGVQS